MNRTRSLARRIFIWGLVLVFFAAVITVAAFGQWTGLLGFSAFPIVGAIILISRPGNGVGWYLLGVGIACLAIMWGLSSDLTALTPPWAESAMNAVASGFWIALPVIGVLYPTGRVETRLGRIAIRSLAGVVVVAVLTYLIDPAPMFTTGRPNPFALPVPGALIAALTGVVGVAVVAIIATIVVDVILRWRRAPAAGRLQYRWFVFGLLGVLALVLIAFSVSAVTSDSLYDNVFVTLTTLSLNLIPISIGIAVTRHGLYEIGRVVSRTVSYAVVTLLVIGVYALIVTSVSGLLPQLPAVGVALATLAAAALFLPVLRAVQRWVDRRFDRERYNAARVVDAFGEHLRTAVNADSTAGELLQAVEQTLQPSTAGLWTAGSPDRAPLNPGRTS